MYITPHLCHAMYLCNTVYTDRYILQAAWWFCFWRTLTQGVNTPWRWRSAHLWETWAAWNQKISGVVWCGWDQPNFSVASDAIVKSYLGLIWSSFLLATMHWRLFPPTWWVLSTNTQDAIALHGVKRAQEDHVCFLTSQVKSWPRSSLLSSTYVPT